MKIRKFIINENLKFTLLSIFIGFLFGAIMLIIAGLDPILIYKTLFIGIFSQPKFVMWSIVYATPIMLTGLAFAFANKTGLFNIGAEGQFIVGVAASALVGYFVKLPFFLHIPLTLVAGCSAGMIWGIIVGFLKNSRGINEVVSAIMFNWIAFYLSNMILNIPRFSRQESDSSEKIQKSAELLFTSGWIQDFFSSEEAFKSYSKASRDLFGTKGNVAFIIAILVIIAINYLLFKTKYGYTLRAVGNNKNASKYAGIDIKKALLISMGISGGLAGLAGALHVMGNSNQMSLLASTENFGFDGISVALIGYNSPIGIIFSAFFFGALKYGGSKLTSVGAPSETVNLVIGFIVYSIAISNGIKMMLQHFKKRSGKNE
jgi:general nucleoside transport system permease protein